MKLAFTTLACPEWDLETIIRKGAEYGFDGVDFRGTGSGIDITEQPEFTAGIEATRALIAESGLVVSGVSSSIRICDTDKLEANLEEARRTIPVALALGAKQIRVFGYGDEGASRAEWVAQGARCMQAILKLEGAEQLDWLLEMHDYWVDSADCRMLLDAVGHPCFRILWDIGHTTRIGTESPETTFAQLGSFIPCVHLKDAVFDESHEFAMKDGWRYVLPGEGQLPLAKAVATLKSGGYAGWYVFEHEKRWHADLEEPDVALQAYVKWLRSLS
ncbi:sugar phosphate isomerase/epimerase family protein [Pelagicoccus sp. SDUM812005]|uniref:sugar phosphate isomerase/epimerase family protein n=1 Tax=Pelagicoccus sp. SDUM812005 TaxID=3041257 RepID=UPI00280E4757|nr:sugar phosphate isomerase/epimerase family protein [Pelagicoccus sp. SDUM812005]MDQ8179946.1 sugar phosphate isomerase/epimerase [Pelagicoccus sp. SDUM812005]